MLSSNYRKVLKSSFSVTLTAICEKVRLEHSEQEKEKVTIFALFHQACFPLIGERIAIEIAHSPPSFVHKIKAKITLFVKRHWFELSSHNKIYAGVVICLFMRACYY